MEEEGKKLPATRKPAARLEEEEIKELDRLEKLRKEAAVLEGKCYAKYESGDRGTVVKMTVSFLYLCNDQCGRLGGSARARPMYVPTEHRT